MTENKLDNFGKVVLYIIKGSPGLCKTQIRKGLFLVDSIYYALHKKSLTGCEYIKEKYGPVPDTKHYKKLSNILIDYAKEKIVEDNFYEKSSYYIKNDLELDIKAEDKKILDIVINFISNKTAKELYSLTHGKVYNKTKMYNLIDLKDVVEWKINDITEEDITNEEELRSLSKKDESAILSFC